MSTDPSPTMAVPGSAAPPPGAPVEPFELGVTQELDPRSVPCQRIAGWLRSAVLFLVGSAGLVFYWTGREPRLVRFLFLAGLLLFVVLASLLATVILPRLAWKHASWRLFPLVLEIRRGVVFRHVLSVPRTRVQHTDVERGPIERRYGLATLVLHTAGHEDSEIRLAGLEHGRALALRDRLLAGSGDGA